MLFACNDRNFGKSCRVIGVAEIAITVLSPAPESSTANSTPDVRADVPNEQLSSTQTALGGDRKRTLQRYEDATESLIDALKLERPGWKAFELLFNLDTVLQSTVDLHRLQESIESKNLSNPNWS